MIIYTDDEALEELLVEGKTKDKRYRSLPPGVVKAYVRVFNTMRSAKDLNALKRIQSLHLEKLQGNLADKYSVRLNKKYRLIFTCSEQDDTIAIVEVTLIEISNHYGT